MKTHLLIALVGLTLGSAAPSFAQQTSTPVGEQDRLQIEASIVKKVEEGCNHNDAVAVAAVFTEDAVQVAPEGLFFGRQAIEKRYAGVFQRWHLTNYTAKGVQLNAIGNEAWAVGEWRCSLEGQNGPVQLRGYDSGIYVRDGGTWKIRLSTFNVAPSPAATATATPSPTATPSSQ